MFFKKCLFFKKGYNKNNKKFGLQISKSDDVGLFNLKIIILTYLF